MRNVERIGFVLILFCTISLLERAGAQDGMSGMSEDDAPARLSTSQLSITAPDGRVVMRLSATPEGAGQIQVYNRTGKVAAKLYARPDQSGEFQLYEARGLRRVAITGSASGGFTNYYSKDGNRAAYIGAEAKNDAGLITVCSGGKPRTELAGLTFGGSVKILNGSGKAVATLGSTSAGSGSLVVAHSGGGSIIQMGRNNSGGGYVMVNNGLSKRVVFLGSSTGKDANEGILELAQPNGKLGAVSRAYRRGSYFQIYDSSGRATKSLR